MSTCSCTAVSLHPSLPCQSTAPQAILVRANLLQPLVLLRGRWLVDLLFCCPRLKERRETAGTEGSQAEDERQQGGANQGLGNSPYWLTKLVG
ncbi:hypothetical protein U9M48_019310 [Paspalum notatum var. saurae]|uniref:Uncharacterized protein n=1 Tax=Paspalum notatum var. saurae TaxID=547442 RepID=A0AAQ3TFF1_PASNO